MRILVTGATGVIGSRVVPMLLARRHEVTAAVRQVAGPTPPALAGATVRALDLFAPAEVQSAVVGHDVVINLATHIPATTRMLAPGAWKENDRIRREGSANLVAAALTTGVKRFIQESFAPIYKDQGDRWINESDPVHPARYSRSVLDAETAVQRFTDQGGIGVVLRFAAFYGPDASQLADMAGFLRHGWLPLPGSARSFLPSVHHDDAAAAVVAALAVPAGIYNVTDDQPLRHRDYADALADALALPHPRLPPAWTAYLAGSIGRTLSRSLRLSNGKLRSASGWAPRHASAREGLQGIGGVLAAGQPAGTGRRPRALAR